MTVENQFDTSCGMPVAGFCMVDWQGDGTPQDLYVDAYQRIEYVGVATDFSIPREHVGEYWVLPDDSMTIRGSELYVRHPVFRIITETWQQAPPPSEENWVYMDANRTTVLYNGPAITDPTGPSGERNYTMGHSNPDGGLGYEQLGPVNAPTGNTTDNYVSPLAILMCHVKGLPTCSSTTAGIINDTQNHTPNVRVGLEFYDVQVPTDPRNLTMGVNATDVLYPPRSTWEPWGVDDASGEDVNTTGSVPSDERRDGPLRIPRKTPPPLPPAREDEVSVLGRVPPANPPDSPITALIVGAAAAGIIGALGAALYSRFNSRKEILRSEARNRLIEIIRENPGISVAEAARSMEITWNTARHHVRMLERLQLVIVRDERGRKVLYVADRPTATVPLWIRRNAIALRIFTGVQASPAGLEREAVHRLVADAPPRTRNYHIRRLLDAGILLEVTTGDGAKRLQVVPCGT